VVSGTFTRVGSLGAVSARQHELVIDVPDAEFSAKSRRDFSLLLFLQARSP
jgi:hypothetical protein